MWYQPVGRRELVACRVITNGFMPDGSPYFDLTHEMDGKPLGTGESLRSRRIDFLNNSG